MSARYVVQVADCAGLYLERDADSFDHALTLRASLVKSYPGKFVGVANLDGIDLGCSDGLTEDEREAAEVSR